MKTNQTNKEIDLLTYIDIKGLHLQKMFLFSKFEKSKTMSILNWNKEMKKLNINI